MPAISPADADHSNIFKNVSESATLPNFEYPAWKSISRSGEANVHYYASDGPGTGTYKLNGSGPSMTLREATEGRQGLFFFDTATNSPPVDQDADGTYDNLADEIQLEVSGYASSGLVYLNANLRTTGGGSGPDTTITAPGEPFIDANANRRYDPDEYFVDLTYPVTIGGSYVKNGMRREIDGYTRQVPWMELSSEGTYTRGANFRGVLYTTGTFANNGSWVGYGSTIATQAILWSTTSSSIYFDERLNEGKWPPSDMNLPRTIVTPWEADPRSDGSDRPDRVCSEPPSSWAAHTLMRPRLPAMRSPSKQEEAASSRRPGPPASPAAH